MYFIKETLDNYKIDKFKREFDYSLLENYKYEEDKIITKVFKQINDLITDKTMKKAKMTNLLKWLKGNEYIKRMETFGNETPITYVTEKGKNLDLYNKEAYTLSQKKYLAVFYNKDAQEFIVNNLESIDNEMAIKS